MSLHGPWYSTGRIKRYLRERVDFAILVWRSDFAMLLPPWSRLRRDSTVVGRLRRRAITTVWEVVTPLPDRMVLATFSLLWPLHSGIRALHLVRHNGRVVQERTRISPLRQWWQSMSLALMHNYGPFTYFQYRFFEDGISPHAFIQTGEFMMLQIRDTRGVDLSVLGRKLRFFDECMQAALPTASIVAVLGRKEERWIDASVGRLPRESLFLKWQDGEQGMGYQRWQYDATGDCWSRSGEELGHDAMLAHCRVLGSGRDLVVQPVIRNHPDIDALNRDTLCTIRVMTYRNPDEPAVFLRACFKVARAGSEVDNLHAGGYACAAAPVTGELGVAYGSRPSDGVHSHHPDSAVQIAGRRLPEFEAAVQLALTAHERLAVPWSVGWDVAITPRGPLLLEGNPMWAADLAQVPHGKPFERDFLERLLARVDGAQGTGSR